MCAALLSTAYLRARWRAAPTLLNHSRAFRRPSPAAPGDTRALRLTDQLGYADLPDWDAEVSKDKLVRRNFIETQEFYNILNAIYLTCV